MRLMTLCLIIYFTGLSSSKAAEKISPAVQAQLDQQLVKNSKRYGIAGQSVLLLKNNKPFYKGRYGCANVELKVPIYDTHLYPGYSVTKLFTSVMMMQLVENGRVDVKQSIRQYLPYLPEHWHNITVEHALNHTSGIPRYFDIAMKQGFFLPTKKEVFLSLSENPAHFEIGTTNRYNNTNYLILSAILEAKTGKVYSELVQSIIIKPLKLQNTGHSSAKAIIPNMVSSYQGKDGVLRKNGDIDWPEYTFAHSGLYSTPKDLATFMTALVSGKFVTLVTLNKLWQPMKLLNGHDGHYAFGFEYSMRDGYQQVGHDGGNRVKLRHYFKTDPSRDSYTIAYLTNGNANDVWTAILADSVMSIINPKQFEMATLTEQFMSLLLSDEKANLEGLFNRLSQAFDGDLLAVENFILNRSYALRYGAGAKASIPAFELLTEKFPKSANAWDSLAQTWQTIGNKEKAIESYQLALAIDPNLTNASNQIAILTK
jgi:D-alanyl-D-alanine carboxypeptidase